MTTNQNNGQNLHGEHGVSGGWNGRGSLRNLVAELDRQRATKIDFVADARSMRVETVKGGANDGALVIRPNPDAPIAIREFVTSEGIEISKNALSQIGARVSPDVPAKFLGELAAARPSRAAELLSGLMADTGRKNLVRCLDGKVRAYLSDQYRILENYDLAFGALDVAREVGAEVLEASLSDRTMRIKLVSKNIFDAIDATRSGGTGWYAGGLGDQKYLSKIAATSKGDLPGGPGTVWPVVTVGNSETGQGGMFVRFGILHGVCFNLATLEDVVTQVHLGSKMEVGMFTAETITADSRAIMLKARDAIAAAFNPDRFKALVAKIKGSNEIEIANPTSAVGNLVENADLSEDAKNSILAHFLADYRPTVYGLSQAVARYAQETDDGDEAGDLESLAGRIITDEKILVG